MRRQVGLLHELAEGFKAAQLGGPGVVGGRGGVVGWGGALT